MKQYDATYLISLFGTHEKEQNLGTQKEEVSVNSLTVLLIREGEKHGTQTLSHLF